MSPPEVFEHLSVFFTLRGKKFGNAETSVDRKLNMLSVHGFAFCIFPVTLK